MAITITGQAASPGRAAGPALLSHPPALSKPVSRCGSESPPGSGRRTAPKAPTGPSREPVAVAILEQAIISAEREIDDLLEADLPPEAHRVLEAQRLMIRDPDLFTALGEAAVKARQETAATAAVQRFFEDKAGEVEHSDDPYIRERAVDIRDAGQRLLRALAWPPSAKRSPRVAGEKGAPVILVAHEILPSTAAALDPARVFGLVSETGSPLGHTAIIARAKGIPAVVGAAGAVAAVKAEMARRPKTIVAVDGTAGTLTVGLARNELHSPSAGQARSVRQPDLRAHPTAPGSSTAPSRRPLGPVVTRDGVRVAVFANIVSPEDIPAALATGAEGVGLFRTEFLLAGRAGLSTPVPTEDDQEAVYFEALMAAGGRELTIRLLDLGGDKGTLIQAPGLVSSPAPGSLPDDEPVPLRGLGFCLAYPDLFRTQIRAVYRAVFRAAGHVGSGHAGRTPPASRARVLLPLAVSRAEVLRAKAFILKVIDELDRESQAPGRASQGITALSRLVPLGAMVETPRLAREARQLVKAVDFIELGTNDLARWAASQRRGDSRGGRSRAGAALDHFEPSILRLASEVVAAATAAGVRAGICGELAADPLAAGLLVGLGLREFSVAAPFLAQVRQALARTDSRQGVRLADYALKLSGAGEVTELLEKENGTR